MLLPKIMIIGSGIKKIIAKIKRVSFFETVYRVRPKNVPRQKLRFLKNRSVNLHVIFTHCKERIYTYFDNM